MSAPPVMVQGWRCKLFFGGDLLDWKYEQVAKRLREAQINIDDKRILINASSLDGEPISGVSFSKDERWVCVPVSDEYALNFIDSSNNEKYPYKPQCFEVVESYSTYLSNGVMSYLTEIRLLRIE